MNKYSNKIIIFCFIHLGDFILSTSAIAILKKTYPKFEITVIAPKNFEDIIENNPVIDKALYCPYPEYNFKSKIKYLLWFITNWIELLTKKYNVAIIFDGSILSTIFSKFILVKKTVDTDKTLATIYAKHLISMPQFIVKSSFGIQNNALPILPDFSKYEFKILKLIDDKNKINIALCIRTAGKKRGKGDNYGEDFDWDLNNFINLINMLNLHINNLYFFIVGVKNDFHYAQRLMSMIKNKNIKNLCGKTSLLELMSFINKTDLLISVDTGTIHIAAITKTPMILIQPSKASTSIPLSSKVRVINKDNINLITPGTVFLAVDEIICNIKK